MKYFVIIMTFVGIFLFGNQASAMWISSSSEQLLEQSGTIFVGSITGITPVEVEYQSQIARNGTIKQSVGSESMTLDEYTIHVEKFLQGPQNNGTINLLQATVGGVPGGPAKIGGFKVGDRVLFYVPKYENQTHFRGQYLPESFKIPEYCDAQTVLKEPNRITEGPFIAIQDGVKKKKEFTANTPIQFSYQKNVGLTGEGFDVLASIIREDENKDEILFDQKVHAESEPCKWLATAKWNIIPPAGNYRMSIGIIEDDHNTGGLLTSFVVNALSPPHSIKIPVDMISPLKQLYSAISPDDVVCKAGLVLVQKHSGFPACVTPETREKLLQRNWAVDFPMKYIIDDRYWGTTYLVHHTTCAHIGVWELSKEETKDRTVWNMTDEDLEKILIIKSMIEYNSHGLYSSPEYPITSTVVSDEIQNQYRHDFDSIAKSKSGTNIGDAFSYNGKYYDASFSIC